MLKRLCVLAIGLLCTLQALPDTMLKPFTAHYSTSWRYGLIDIDINAVRTLQPIDEKRWSISFNAKTKGASLSERSVFQIKNGTLIPEHYQYQGSGLLKGQQRDIQFDYSKQQITNQLTGKPFDQAWDTPQHDPLTYMLQAGLDLQSGSTDLHYQVFEKTRNKLREFVVVGEETLNTDIGRLRAVKVEQVRDDNRKIQAWFSLDHNYQLVQLRETVDGKRRYKINITRLSFH